MDIERATKIQSLMRGIDRVNKINRELGSDVNCDKIAVCAKQFYQRLEPIELTMNDEENQRLKEVIRGFFLDLEREYKNEINKL